MVKGKKKNRQYQKKVSLRPQTRKKPPKISQEGKTATIMCPFCIAEHPISTEKPSACGTLLVVMAEQTTYRGRAVKCTVCGERNGQMTKIGSGYRHAENCAPGVTFYDEEAEINYSKVAEFLHNRLPDKAMLLMAEKFGYTTEKMVGVDEDGKRSDNVTGYRWKKVDINARQKP